MFHVLWLFLLHCPEVNDEGILLQVKKRIFMHLPFCVYILFSEVDHLLYIGFTTNLEERVIRHNSGRNKSTAPRRPLKLIFTEHYLFKEDALKREEYFKTTMGKKAIKLMLKGTLEKMEYKNPVKRISIVSEQSDERV